MADALTAAFAEVVRAVAREELAAMLAELRMPEEPRELGESLTVAEAAREVSRASIARAAGKD